MRIKLFLVAYLFASAQFLRAEAIAGCRWYPFPYKEAYGATAAQVDCQVASASVSFSLVGPGPAYYDVVSLSIEGGPGGLDTGAWASPRVPLVVVGGPPRGRLKIYSYKDVVLSYASFGYAWMQIGDHGLGYDPYPEFVGYTRGQPRGRS